MNLGTKLTILFAIVGVFIIVLLSMNLALLINKSDLSTIDKPVIGDFAVNLADDPTDVKKSISRPSLLLHDQSLSTNGFVVYEKGRPQTSFVSTLSIYPSKRAQEIHVSSTYGEDKKWVFACASFQTSCPVNLVNINTSHVLPVKLSLIDNRVITLDTLNQEPKDMERYSTHTSEPVRLLLNY